ncbi:MAG: hypothetical protein AAF226_14805, partial [Verrucomicrobiota bacterium]
MAWIPEAVIAYDWRELKDRRQIGGITILRPDVYIDEKMLEAIAARRQGGAASTGFDLAAMQRFTGPIVIEDGKIYADLPNLPSVSGKWAFSTEPIVFDAEDLTENEFHIQLQDIELGENGVFGRADALDTTFRVKRDLKKFVIDDFQCERPRVTIDPQWLFPGGVPPKREKDAKSPIDFVIQLERAVLNHARIAVKGFDGKKENLAAIPDISGTTSLDWTGLYFDKNGLQSKGPLSLEVQNLVVGDEDSQMVRAAKATATVPSFQAMLKERRVTSVIGEFAEIEISDNTLKRYQGRPKSNKVPKAWVFDQIVFEDSHYLMKELKKAPSVRTRFDAQITDFTITGGVLSSPDVQALQLRDIEMRGPGVSMAEPALLDMAKADVSIVWDEFARKNQVRKLTAEAPSILITDQTLGLWSSEESDSTAEDDFVGPVNRPIYRVDELDLGLGEVELDTLAFNGVVPKVKARFTLENDALTTEVLDDFKLQLLDIELRNHGSLPEPMIGGLDGPPSLFPPQLLPENLPEVASEEVIRVDQ